MNKLALLLMIQVALLGICGAEDRGVKIVPKPNALIPIEVLKPWIGEVSTSSYDKPFRILWLCGPEDHGGGEHDYIRTQELFVPMLEKIEGIEVDTAFRFPTAEQFLAADILVMYLHLPDLSDGQHELLDQFIQRGGGVLTIHESCIMRPIDRAEKLSRSIGCSWDGNSTSHWGKFDQRSSVVLDTSHPVFFRLPKVISLRDESYWNLRKQETVRVVGAIAPADFKSSFVNFSAPQTQSGVRPDAFWVYERGDGRVFGTTLGHYSYTFHDPFFRLILMRGLAWVGKRSSEPLMTLVTDGLVTASGKVGTQDDMLSYTNRDEVPEPGRVGEKTRRD